MKADPVIILRDLHDPAMKLCLRRNKRLAELETAAWIEIADVFEWERTTSEERDGILSRWLAGEVGGYIALANQRGLSPIALLAACLIDSEHPVFCPEGVPITGSLVGLYVLIYCMEIVRIRQSIVILPAELAAGILSLPETC